MSPESTPQQNPFELIKYKDMFVPELLTHEDREKDLNEYIKGWNDQSKNPVEILVPVGEKTGFRTPENWYQVGAVKRWQQFSDTLSEGTTTIGHEKDLVDVMNNMRNNGISVPDHAWPNTENNDEEEDSSTSRFS